MPRARRYLCRFLKALRFCSAVFVDLAAGMFPDIGVCFNSDIRPIEVTLNVLHTFAYAQMSCSSIMTIMENQVFDSSAVGHNNEVLVPPQSSHKGQVLNMFVISKCRMLHTRFSNMLSQHSISIHSMVCCVRSCCNYFTLFIDNMPNTYLDTQPTLSRRQACGVNTYNASTLLGCSDLAEVASPLSCNPSSKLATAVLAVSTCSGAKPAESQAASQPSNTFSARIAASSSCSCKCSSE